MAIRECHLGLFDVATDTSQLSQMPWLDQVTYKNPILLWLNRKGWVRYTNPFEPLVHRQFVERQKFWQDTNGRPSDREMILDVLLRIQKEHPEVQDFQSIMHSFSIIGGSSESM